MAALQTPADDQLFHQLCRYGWVQEDEVCAPEQLETVVREYQAFHGLRPDGRVGSVTERHLSLPRFCALPDRAPTRQRLCKWEKNEIQLQIAGGLPHISDGALRAAVQEAFGYWADVCDLRFAFGEPGDIVITTGRIDGPSGTLAWSELPCGPDRALRQKYDDTEPYVISLNPPPGKLDLVRIIAHEGGHAIGIDHLGGGNLMQSTYDPTIRTPQAGDVAEAVGRYGKPPTPDPIDPVPGQGVTLFIPGAKVLT